MFNSLDRQIKPFSKKIKINNENDKTAQTGKNRYLFNPIHPEKNHQKTATMETKIPKPAKETKKLVL